MITVSFCIPAVPTGCVGLNAESPTDDLLLQASQLFAKKEEEEEGALLLAASQHYEKRCSPLMSSEDIHSAVLDQVPLNTKKSTKKCHFSSARLWQV